MAHIERRHRIVLAGAIDRVFPPFTPEGERLWEDEWDPEYLHPENGEPCEGMVRRVWEKYARDPVAGSDGQLASCYCYDDRDPDAITVFQLHADPAGPGLHQAALVRRLPAGDRRPARMRGLRDDRFRGFASAGSLPPLAHVPAKWIPVRRQEHAPSRNLQPFLVEALARADSI